MRLKHLSKETLKERREQLHELLDVALDLQLQGNDVFIRYTGHVSSIGVDIYDGEWSRDKDSYYREEYIDRNECYVDEMINKLKAMRDLTI